MSRVGGDQIVGLEPIHLDPADAESVRRLPHMRQLRREIIRHLPAVRLVLIVDLVAEAAAGSVEDHGYVVGIGIPQVFVQHIAEMHDDFRRHAIGLALEPLCLGILGARKIGPKDEPRAVDQIYVVRRCRRGMRRGCRAGFGNDRFDDDLVHGSFTQALRDSVASGTAAPPGSAPCIARLTKRREQ